MKRPRNIALPEAAMAPAPVTDERSEIDAAEPSGNAPSNVAKNARESGAIPAWPAPPPVTRAVMFVSGFRQSRSFVCGQEKGGAGGCRQSVELWRSPNGTEIVVDQMAGDNSPWMVHICPARRT